MARFSFVGTFPTICLAIIGLQALRIVEAVDNESDVAAEVQDGEQDNKTDMLVTDMIEHGQDEVEDFGGGVDDVPAETEDEDAEVVDPFANVSTPMTISLADGELRVMMRKANGSEELFTLEFGFAEELDSDGDTVRGRSLSIADASRQDEAIFTAEVGLISGAKALITRLILPLALDESCEEGSTSRPGGKELSGKGSSGKGSSGKGSSGKGSRGKGSSVKGSSGKASTGKGSSGKVSTEEASSGFGSSGSGKGSGDVASTIEDAELDVNSTSYFAIEAFVFLEDADVEYGDEVVEVNAGEMKFNIESALWPFCGDDHSLRVDVGLKLPGENHTAKHFGDVDGDDETEDPDTRDEQPATQGSGKSGRSARSSKKGGHGGKGGKGAVRGKMLIADSGLDEVFVSMPTVAIVDGNETNCTVGFEERESSLRLFFSFPHFDETLFYDPVGGSTTFDFDAWQTSALQNSIMPSDADASAESESRTEFSEKGDIDDLTDNLAAPAGFSPALSVTITIAAAVAVCLRE